jgi:hypothetical protein
MLRTRKHRALDLFKQVRLGLEPTIAQQELDCPKGEGSIQRTSLCSKGCLTDPEISPRAGYFVALCALR